MLSNSSRPRAVLKSFLQTLQISFTIYLSLSPSLFLSFDSWPTSFRRKKAESKQKIDEIRKCCCLLALMLLLRSFLFFSVFSSSICCCRCWFCSIAKHILVTDLFFCSLFSLPACLLLLLLLRFVCVPLSEIPLAVVLPTSPSPFLSYCKRFPS